MLEIHFSAYYSIDIKSKQIEHQTSKILQENIRNYIEEHLIKIHDQEDIRQYSIKPNQTTEVINCINQILKSQNQDEAKKIAQRLLDKEIATQNKIKHLNNELQKGGLIITHYTNGSKSFFVIAKVHFIDVRMESDFKKDKATPEKEHMLKTVIIPIIDNSATLEQKTNTVLVTDSTKSKGALAATFWWDQFLELDTIITDEDNTKIAFNKIDNYCKRTFYDKGHNMDYFASRNSLISYMKNSTTFNLSEIADNILGDLSTFDCATGLSDEERKFKKDEIAKDIQSLNQKNDALIFDSTFSVVNDIIKHKMKQNIKLHDAINLTLSDEIENLRDKIIADSDEKGNHIKIYSEQGYNVFKK